MQISAWLAEVEKTQNEILLMEAELTSGLDRANRLFADVSKANKSIKRMLTVVNQLVGDLEKIGEEDAVGKI